MAKIEMTEVLDKYALMIGEQDLKKLNAYMEAAKKILQVEDEKFFYVKLERQEDINEEMQFQLTDQIEFND